MSTDLHQLHHELPNLHVSAIQMNKNNTPSSGSDESSDDSINTTSPVIKQSKKETKQIQNDVDNPVTTTTDENCLTPTTKESKIPEILSCPPAPRKPKTLVSCKRKLMSEFQFFEYTNKEDMDAFFRSTFPKRTCHCTLMNN